MDAESRRVEEIRQGIDTCSLGGQGGMTRAIYDLLAHIDALTTRLHETERERDGLALERDGLEFIRKKDNQYLLDKLAQAEQRIKELEDTVCDDAVHQALVRKVAQAEQRVTACIEWIEEQHEVDHAPGYDVEGCGVCQFLAALSPAPKEEK